MNEFSFCLGARHVGAGSLRGDADHSVAVVITTYNHAHFLGDAIRSALAQTSPVSEVVVVDDGSSDDPGSVVARFSGVRLISQPNQGLAAARNTGLRAATSDVIVFLDADDRLLANAVGDGLACFAKAPRCGLVYGGHRRTGVNWEPQGPDRYAPIAAGYNELLQGNLVGMHAAAMYRRECLTKVGGFDVSLRRCEDYDVYLRMAQAYPISSHPNIVAEYRIHGSNMSADPRDMLGWVLSVTSRQKRFAFVQPGGAQAWRRGRSVWREYYSQEALCAAKAAWRQKGEMRRAARRLMEAALMSPRHIVSSMGKQSMRRLRDFMPSTVRQWVRRFRTAHRAPALGRVRFGDLARTTPIDDDFGFGRGTPIDRGYIADFLSRHANDIAGRVLEVGDDEYSRRFGGPKVNRQDILHVRPGNSHATIVGDLAQPGVLPEAAFDCMVLTQTLHLIYDMRAAVRQIHHALKPNGIVLLTVPGISQIDRGEWRTDWCWSLTEGAARRILGEEFGESRVEVESYGNVFAATAFLHGLALEEVSKERLNARDAAYPVIVAVRARKSAEV